MINQAGAQEEGLFFIVERPGGKRHDYEVMSTAEVEDSPESVQLVSGHFNTRAEAEADLQKGITNGSY